MTTTYDALPYEDYAHPEAHPDHLAAVAWMFGHPAVPPGRARVLEIGCATGGHLLPMAEALPEATWVGVDLSPAQIAAASATRDALGLHNVALHALSFTDLDDRFRGFDYVICHGVFSWVPEALQGALLAAVRRCLGPEGVAFVSFNAQPGWCVGERVRDFLRMHGGAELAPAVRVERARVALGLLCAAEVAGGSAVSQALRAEARRARDADPSYLFHEYLEADNHPMYLREFVAAAEAAGLRHLGDARLPRNSLAALSAADPLGLEQTADFLQGRRFRAALLVGEERPPARMPDPAVCAALRWSTGFALAADADAASLGRREGLDFWDGARTVTLSEPLAKCALVVLAEAEGSPVLLGEVCDAVAERLGAPGLRGQGAWFAEQIGLVGMALEGVVVPHAMGPRYVRAAGLRPVAAGYARWQAARGAVVTTRRHTQVTLDGFCRDVIGLLDGSRDRGEVCAELGAVWGGGGGLALRCEEALELLARNALLCG